MGRGVPPSWISLLSRSSWNSVLLGVCRDFTAQAHGLGGDPGRPVCSDSSSASPAASLPPGCAAGALWNEEGPNDLPSDKVGQRISPWPVLIQRVGED